VRRDRHLVAGVTCGCAFCSGSCVGPISGPAHRHAAFSMVKPVYYDHGCMAGNDRRFGRSPRDVCIRVRLCDNAVCKLRETYKHAVRLVLWLRFFHSLIA
jgi:hypothetical protein